MERGQGYHLVDHETHSVHGSESFPHRNAVQFEWLTAEGIGQLRPGADRGWCPWSPGHTQWELCAEERVPPDTPLSFHEPGGTSVIPGSR